MANISITDLQPAGSGFFADSESFINLMTDLSENELKLTRGGGCGWGGGGSGGGGSYKSGKSYKKSKSHKGSGGSCGCGYGC